MTQARGMEDNGKGHAGDKSHWNELRQFVWRGTPSRSWPDTRLLVRYSSSPYSIILNAASRIVSTADVSLPGGRSLEVLNAATTAFPFAGFRYMNARNPAWLPVWPIRVARPRGSPKKESPIDSV